MLRQDAPCRTPCFVPQLCANSCTYSNCAHSLQAGRAEAPPTCLKFACRERFIVDVFSGANLSRLPCPILNLYFSTRGHTLRAHATGLSLGCYSTNKPIVSDGHARCE